MNRTYVQLSRHTCVNASFLLLYFVFFRWVNINLVQGKRKRVRSYFFCRRRISDVHNVCKCVLPTARMSTLPFPVFNCCLQIPFVQVTLTSALSTMQTRDKINRTPAARRNFFRILVVSVEKLMIFW